MIVTAIGRRWSGKNGTTYHSVNVYIDGDYIGRVPFRYGYGSAYKNTAMEFLAEKGIEPFAEFSKFKNQPIHVLIYKCTDIKIVAEGINVATKKEL